MAKVAASIVLLSLVAAAQGPELATYWPPVLFADPSNPSAPRAHEFTIPVNDFAQVAAVASDGQGNIYLAGYGRATNIPGLERGFQPKPNGQDAFIIKLGPRGNVLWSSYLGGTDERGIDGYDGEYVYAVAADARGVYVLGTTVARNFPIVNAFRPTGGGYFIAKFSADGKLLYSSYLEGGGSEIVLGPAGDAWILIAGYVGSVSATHDLSRGRRPSYVVKLNSAGQPVWTTAVGVGSARGFGVDSAGRSYVAGANCSGPSGRQECEFIAVQLDTSGAHLGYETYVVDKRAGAVTPTVTSTGQLIYYGLSCETALPPRRNVGVQPPDCDRGSGNRWAVTLDHTGAVESVKYVDINVNLQSFGTTTDLYDRVILVTNTTSGQAATRRALVNHHVDGPLYVSEDRGVTWSTGRGVMPEGSESVFNQVTDLDFDSDRNTVYATSLSPRGLYDSADNGRTWQFDRRATAPRGGRAQSQRSFSTLTLDRFDAAIRYSTMSGDLMRHDRNSDWEMVLPGSGDSFQDPYWSSVETNPHDGSIWALSRGRIAISADRGETWTHKSVPRSVGRIAFDPARPTRVYGAGAGLFVSDDNGGSWREVPLGSPTIPGVASIALHGNGNVIYAGTQTFSAAVPTGVLRSIDEGRTWVTKLPGHHITAITADLVGPYVYAAAIDQTQRAMLYRSADFGETWQLAMTGLDVRRQIRQLLIDPRDSSRIYLGAYLSTVPYIARIDFDSGLIDFASYLGHGTAWAVTTSPTGEIIVGVNVSASRYIGQSRIGVVVIDDERRNATPAPRRPQ